MSGTSLFASAIFLLCPLQDRKTPNSPHALGPTAAAQAAEPAGLTTSDWSSIRDAYEANRHKFFATEKGWQARNPGRGWITTADERGILMQPDGGDWTWGLELVSYGWGESQNAISVRPATSVDGVRLARIWDARLTEWYVNDRRGLEHGFIISERPKNLLAPLTLQLSIRGGLRPSISPDGRNISFVDSRGNSALNYNGLEVFDVTGRSVAAQWMKAQNDRIQLVVEDAAVPYPLTIDPIVQQAYLKASNTGGGDAFGYSVAVSGNTVVVGSPAEASNATGVNGNQANNDYGLSGAAYVFVRNGGAWSQQAYLKASNTDGLDFFGISVAISGNTIVVGAEGEASNATGVNGNQLNNSALDAGAAYVFIRSGSTWSQQAYLKASNAGQADRFGGSVAISSDTIVVGAMEEDSNAAGVNGNQANNTLTGSGAAYVFVRNHNTWTQQAYLKASNPGGNRYFGGSVAASGDTIVVGARNDSSSATGVNGNQSDTTAPSAGAAYIFFRSGSTWSQQAYLKASNTAAQDNFGYSVAASGDTVVVGAYGEDSGASGVNGNQADNSASDSGAAYVFVRSGSTWSQQAYLKASNTSAQDNFGYSVAASGDTAVVGAIGEDSGSTGVNGNQADNTSADSGAAYVFLRSSGTWSQLDYLKASNTGIQDNFGTSVAASGDTVAVGAYFEDSAATGVNGVQSDNSADLSGATYIFDLGISSGTSGYGPGSPGCFGVHLLKVSHAPMINSPDFKLLCDNAPLLSLGLGILADAPDLAGSDPFGIGVLLHVDLFASTEIITLDFFSDALGNGFAAAPIPNAQALVGKTYYAIALWSWTTCSLPPYNLSTSKGLAITVLVP